jgi:two-component system, NarL family, sensor histidine kinase DevS
VTVDAELPLRHLLDVGQMLVSDLDTRVILERVLNAARKVTDARYAALGVLDESRTKLSEFITAGVDEDTRRMVGAPPHGRGVLGVLISESKPLRLRRLGEHPNSYGVPEGHPQMTNFLGVPIMIRGEAWGNLYLADKMSADEFSAADEEAVVILASWAAAAIENARLYERSESRRRQLERAVRGLEATRDIAVAIGGATGIERVLELVVKRARALVDARTLLILLREHDHFVVAAGAGYVDGARGRRVPVDGSLFGQILEHGRAERIADVSSRLGIEPDDLGVTEARVALLVPMLHRGEGVGLVAAFDRLAGTEPFTESDEQLLGTFAASAANAIALARSVEADRLRSSLAAADAERKHWARELHDETLQILGGLRVLLSGTLRRGDADRYEIVMAQAIDGIEQGIAGLRAIITDLRPAALDELGLTPAIVAVIERRRKDGLKITAVLELPDESYDPELETAVYRLVQESLTNVVKHSGATHVEVAVIGSDDQITIDVQDNGSGFEPGATTSGFGLGGMRERVYLCGGELQINSNGHGTRVRAVVPAARNATVSARAATA